MTTAYPLTWPEHIPRATKREAGQFRTTLAGALDNVETSLKAFGRDSSKAVIGVVLSSNVTLSAQKPEDPGVAVWFTWDDVQVCIPVDRYLSPAANLQAIHHVIEARRTELRHGTLALVRASFQGLRVLPSPARASWWQVLRVDQRATVADIDEAFKALARERHPDRGGSDAAMSELNQARAEGLKERGNA